MSNFVIDFIANDNEGDAVLVVKFYSNIILGYQSVTDISGVLLWQDSTDAIIPFYQDKTDG